MNSASASQSSQISPSTAIPLTPIASAVQSIRENQTVTHDLLDALYDRLNSVLRPVPTSPVGGECKANECSVSPLHEELVGRAEVAASLNDRISALLNRLTV